MAAATRRAARNYQGATTLLLFAECSPDTEEHPNRGGPGANQGEDEGWLVSFVRGFGDHRRHRPRYLDVASAETGRCREATLV